MEATDLEARRQDAKHETRRLTREGAGELYARLDDAGLDARLTRAKPEILAEESDERHYVVEVDPDSIDSPEHLRLLADQAIRRRILVKGIYSRIRLG